MKSTIYVLSIAFAACLIWASCAEKKKSEKPLSAYELLGSEPDDLLERFGEPTQYRKGTLIRWKSFNGVRIFAHIREGKVGYVAYTFEAMKPFDEQKALQMIGIELPEEGGKYVAGTKARRWSPFGEYQKLTISPRTKLISIGTDPLRTEIPEK